MRFSGLLAALALLSPLAAQNDPFFPQPSYFKKHFSNTPTHVELQPPVKLNDFVVGGTLELSLRNYLELVVANNPSRSSRSNSTATQLRGPSFHSILSPPPVSAPPALYCRAERCCRVHRP
jgi:hypothetical protein